MVSVAVVCPKCGCADFEFVQDEVDIGVGVQVHTRGGRCAVCGELNYCTDCATFEGPNGLVHAFWCSDVRGG